MQPYNRRVQIHKMFPTVQNTNGLNVEENKVPLCVGLDGNIYESPGLFLDFLFVFNVQKIRE